MRILLASPRGFCAGVNMAIETLRLTIERFGTPTYVFHEIVHNKWVVNDFLQRGAIFVNDLTEVPEGKHVVFSAHGVSPEARRIAQQRNLQVIDATCPLVTKVHREALRLAEAGYTIVLIGHAGHDEVVGTMGEAPESMVLVENVEDVDGIDVDDPEKIAYLTQTTLSVVEANAIIERLRSRLPNIVGPRKEDICFATTNRQEAVRTLSQEADLVLVVGSQNSSNSKRLAELARSQDVPAYLIDGPDDVDLSWFDGVHTVLLTAGASAPEWVVESCVKLLQERFDATVEPRVFHEEKIRFILPEPLREKKR